jgi:hypothetical protein
MILVKMVVSLQLGESPILGQALLLSCSPAIEFAVMRIEVTFGEFTRMCPPSHSAVGFRTRLRVLR